MYGISTSQIQTKFNRKFPDFSVDVSKIYHVNAGRKRFRIYEACKLLDLAQNDPRLTGLNIIHLRPELAQTGVGDGGSRRCIRKVPGYA